MCGKCSKNLACPDAFRARPKSGRVKRGLKLGLASAALTSAGLLGVTSPTSAIPDDGNRGTSDGDDGARAEPDEERTEDTDESLGGGADEARSSSPTDYGNDGLGTATTNTDTSTNTSASADSDTSTDTVEAGSENDKSGESATDTDTSSSSFSSPVSSFNNATMMDWGSPFDSDPDDEDVPTTGAGNGLGAGQVVGSGREPVANQTVSGSFEPSSVDPDVDVQESPEYFDAFGDSYSTEQAARAADIEMATVARPSQAGERSEPENSRAEAVAYGPADDRTVVDAITGETTIEDASDDSDQLAIESSVDQGVEDLAAVLTPLPESEAAKIEQSDSQTESVVSSDVPVDFDSAVLTGGNPDVDAAENDVASSLAAESVRPEVAELANQQAEPPIRTIDSALVAALQPENSDSDEAIEPTQTNGSLSDSAQPTTGEDTTFVEVPAQFDDSGLAPVEQSERPPPGVPAGARRWNSLWVVEDPETGYADFFNDDGSPNIVRLGSMQSGSESEAEPSIDTEWLQQDVPAPTPELTSGLTETQTGEADAQVDGLNQIDDSGSVVEQQPEEPPPGVPAGARRWNSLWVVEDPETGYADFFNDDGSPNIVDLGTVPNDVDEESELDFGDDPTGPQLPAPVIDPSDVQGYDNFDSGNTPADEAEIAQTGDVVADQSDGFGDPASIQNSEIPPWQAVVALGTQFGGSGERVDRSRFDTEGPMITSEPFPGHPETQMITIVGPRSEDEADESYVYANVSERVAQRARDLIDSDPDRWLANEVAQSLATGRFAGDGHDPDEVAAVAAELSKPAGSFMDRRMALPESMHETKAESIADGFDEGDVDHPTLVTTYEPITSVNAKAPKSVGRKAIDLLGKAGIGVDALRFEQYIDRTSSRPGVQNLVAQQSVDFVGDRIGANVGLVGTEVSAGVWVPGTSLDFQRTVVPVDAVGPNGEVPRPEDALDLPANGTTFIGGVESAVLGGSLYGSSELGVDGKLSVGAGATVDYIPYGSQESPYTFIARGEEVAVLPISNVEVPVGNFTVGNGIISNAETIEITGGIQGNWGYGTTASPPAGNRQTQAAKAETDSPPLTLAEFAGPQAGHSMASLLDGGKRSGVSREDVGTRGYIERDVNGFVSGYFKADGTPTTARELDVIDETKGRLYVPPAEPEPPESMPIVRPSPVSQGAPPKSPPAILPNTWANTLKGAVGGAVKVSGERFLADIGGDYFNYDATRVADIQNQIDTGAATVRPGGTGSTVEGRVDIIVKSLDAQVHHNGQLTGVNPSTGGTSGPTLSRKDTVEIQLWHDRNYNTSLTVTEWVSPGGSAGRSTRPDDAITSKVYTAEQALNLNKYEAVSVREHRGVGAVDPSLEQAAGLDRLTSNIFSTADFTMTVSNQEAVDLAQIALRDRPDNALLQSIAAYGTENESTVEDQSYMLSVAKLSRDFADATTVLPALEAMYAVHREGVDDAEATVGAPGTTDAGSPDGQGKPDQVESVSPAEQTQPEMAGDPAPTAVEPILDLVDETVPSETTPVDRDSSISEVELPAAPTTETSALSEVAGAEVERFEVEVALPEVEIHEVERFEVGHEVALSEVEIHEVERFGVDADPEMMQSAERVPLPEIVITGPPLDLSELPELPDLGGDDDRAEESDPVCIVDPNRGLLCFSGGRLSPLELGTAVVVVNNELTAFPVCLPEADSDGDGWGWKNGRTCIVVAFEQFAGIVRR